ncbi:MAG: hypothetical protein ACP5E8_04175 [Thermoplasmata archaeon]
MKKMCPIRFEPNDGYFMVLKIHIENPIPERFQGVIFDNGKSDHFGVGLVRINKRWFLFIDKLKFLPNKELNVIIDFMNSEFEKSGNDIMVELEGKAIKRGVTKASNQFLNGLAETEGVIIYSVALMGQHDVLIAIKYPETVASAVDDLYFEYINSVNYNVEIVTLEKEHEGDIPSFFKFHNIINIDYSRLLMIKTVWNMKMDESRNENEGIFQNEMTFKPKFFDPESSPLYGEIVANLKEKEIKGRAEFKIISNSEEGRLIEFRIKSKWFYDFYNDVVRPLNGPFFYWGYSNGKNVHENYYIIPIRNEIEFLKGISKHWGEQSRAHHNNVITYVEPLNEVVKKHSFIKGSNIIIK